MRWPHFSFIFLLLFCVSCSTTQSHCQGCATKPKKLKPQVVFQAQDGTSVIVRVEVACTPNERAQGLMYRKQMDEFAGMLFIFPVMSQQSFWMKNTYIPLDMIHLNEKKEIVGIVENARPHTLTSRKVNVPSIYVIEVNAFFARRKKIKVGQKVRFIDIPSCG